MKRILPLIISLIFISSCEYQKEIDYYTKYDSPKIITHGYICPQYGAQIVVKKTTSPSDVNGDDRLVDASVLLYNSANEFLLMKKMSDYRFVCDSIDFIKENEKFYIEVNSDQLGSVSSGKQTILSAPKIDSTNIIEGKRNKLRVYFDNDYGEKKSFYLEVTYFIDGKIDSTNIERRSERFSPFEFEKDREPGLNIAEYELEDYSECDSMLVQLHVLSEELREFLVSQDYYDTSHEDIFYPQPYVVYTNIAGGFGIFATHSYSSVIVNKLGKGYLYSHTK